MIDLHYWPTPNGQKIRIFLEEAGLEYHAHKVDISKVSSLNQNSLLFRPITASPLSSIKTPKMAANRLAFLNRAQFCNISLRKRASFYPVISAPKPKSCNGCSG